MSKELVISSNRHETKVAILEDDQLVEVYFQRANEYSLAGSVHKGRVTRVLPGMQSAFVDLGLDRDTFLYVSDFFEESGEDIDRVADERPRGGDRRERGGDRVNRGDRGEARGAVSPASTETVEVAAEPVEEPVAEPLVESAAPPAIVAPPQEKQHVERPPEDGGNSGRDRGDRGDRGDRDARGRRSRRRRNRGRGFPESKYASTHEARAESEPEERVEVEDASASSFAVLPGESLAKYRAPEPESDSDIDMETEIDAESDQAIIVDAEPEPETSEDAAEIEPDSPEPTDEGVPAEPVFVGPVEVAETNGEGAFPPDVATIANDNPEELPPANAIPDAPAHHDNAEGSAVGEAQETEEDVPAEDASAAGFDATVPEREEEDASDEEPVAEEEEPAPRTYDDDEDREIQALILEGDTSDIEEMVAPDAPMSANVREQGGRYMHRSSRRMRRRSRGGPMQQEQPPAAPPPPPPPAPRQEHRPASRPDKGPMPLITDLLKEGQEILVQIAKEPLGQKGARITSHIALPGRYVVYMPTLDHMGVSRKIASDEERQRLKKILQKHRVGVPGGYIIRTAGEGKTEDDIAADMTFLANLWLDIRQKAEKRPAPALLHHDLDIVQRVLRDQVSETYKSIWVDSEEVYESILRFLQRFQPALVGRVKLYTRAAPVFDAFNITNELEKALRPKVWLKSGGYIVINQTEALVAIDVNTGKFVGKSNRLEDTIVKTNTEAVKEIVRQLRLRDLGGIIVIDFIDMDERKNRQKVMQTLEEAMRADRAPYKILQFNDFGLVAITRKRVKQSLERTLCAPCPYCEGAGYVKSVQTIIGEILQEAHKIARAVEGQDVILRVHPDVAKVLKSNTNRYLEEIEEILKRPVLVTSDAALHHEKFDLA